MIDFFESDLLQILLLQATHYSSHIIVLYAGITSNPL